MGGGPDQPIVEAHRGASAVCPENSMAAFRRAAAMGARAIELDVHESRDGAIVVMHDATVDRTTNKTGRIADLDLVDILALDCGSWKGPTFSAERVPTLDRVLAWAQKTGCVLNVEVKTFQPASPAPRKLTVLLQRYAPATGNHVVSSFDREALLQVRHADAQIPLAFLGEGAEAVATAVEMTIPWVHLAWDSVDADIVSAARDARLRIMVWTVDDDDCFSRMVDLGVDKICTNRPDHMLQVLQQNP